MEEINLNIIKSMSRKFKDEINTRKDDVLLLCDNITVTKNIIKTRYKNLKKNFIIPYRFHSFKNSNLVKIIVDVIFKIFLRKGMNIYEIIIC